MNTTLDELDRIAQAAATAAPLMASATDEERAGWLNVIAAALDAQMSELVALAAKESHLGDARLAGELARTTAQLRLFAGVVAEGSYREAIIDHANPDATPPSPDLRRMLIPLGPVAVFSASNFPFAFSVAGGDTASALAVGNPVIVKAHEGHPELSEFSGRLVSQALADAGAPDGAFTVVVGREIGAPLVQHPLVQAVGFTGSVGGGRALFDLANARPQPIPFYGELGSLNPVVITPAAIAARAEELASGLTTSFTLGAGQFCTKPGVVFVPSDAAQFVDAVASATPVDGGATLLTRSIREGFPAGLSALASDQDVTVVAGTAEQSADDPARPVVLLTTTAAVVARPDSLLEECFGPVTLLVRYESDEDLREAIAALPGSLTATVHAEPDEDVAQLLSDLTPKTGRLLFGGWPTGVAVNWAQHHGGPYPATTSLYTSVGATAARRFQRPVAYQTLPDALLPAALQEGNPLGIPRRVDGVYSAGDR